MRLRQSEREITVKPEGPGSTYAREGSSVKQAYTTPIEINVNASLASSLHLYMEHILFECWSSGWDRPGILKPSFGVTMWTWPLSWMNEPSTHNLSACRSPDKILQDDVVPKAFQYSLEPPFATRNALQKYSLRRHAHRRWLMHLKNLQKWLFEAERNCGGHWGFV